MECFICGKCFIIFPPNKFEVCDAIIEKTHINPTKHWINDKDKEEC